MSGAIPLTLKVEIRSTPTLYVPQKVTYAAVKIAGRARHTGRGRGAR